MDITPDLRLSNWITHKPYGEKLEPIFARALVLAQGSNRVACVSWELLYPMEGAVAEARQRIQKRTGIPAENILISATHNHSAPWSPVIDDPLTKAEQKVLDSFLNDPVYPAWKESMLEQTVQAVQKADSSRVPATLSIGRAYAGDVIFNRRPRKPDGKVMGMANPTNPFALPQGLRFGPVDPTLTILSLPGNGLLPQCLVCLATESAFIPATMASPVIGVGSFRPRSKRKQAVRRCFSRAVPAIWFQLIGDSKHART